MTDQCKHCSLRGDLKSCLATECFHHENWYAVEQQKRIDKLEAENRKLEEVLKPLETLCAEQVNEINKLKGLLSETKSDLKDLVHNSHSIWFTLETEMPEES